MIAWEKITPDEDISISRIAARAINDGLNCSKDKMSLVMDISAAHLDVGLDLHRLRMADDTNFAHDVLGIQKHLDRDTGKLMNCFLPRMLKKAARVAG